MIKRHQRLINWLNALSDFVIVLISMALAYVIRFQLMPGVESYPISFYVRLALLSALGHVVAYYLVGFYHRIVRKHSLMGVSSKILLTETGCMLIIMAVFFLLDFADASRKLVLIDYVLNTALMILKHIIGRGVMHYLRRRGYNIKYVLLIGSGECAQEYLRQVMAHPEYGYKVEACAAEDEGVPGVKRVCGFDGLDELLGHSNPDEAVIALRPEEYPHMRRIIAACEKAGVYLQIIPCFDACISSRMTVGTFEGMNMMGIRDIPLNRAGNAVVKRLADILLSLFFILLTSPLMLLAVVGVKLSSPGPILFKQERIGKNKKPFKMLKFRSMRLNAKQQTGWSRDHDDRRTAFGSFIRKFSIDELPQFFNVLRGDMSIVGPRPEVPFFVDRFREEIPLYMIKHYVKPGITGWAQVHGLRGDTSIEKRIEYDIWYIENWTWWLDVKIMFMTVFKMKNTEKL